MHFFQGTTMQMNVAAGFTTGFSFYYSIRSTTGVVTVYDGLNATGNILATLSLPATWFLLRCTFTYSCWARFGVSFRGLANPSISRRLGHIGFDNITIGSTHTGWRSVDELSGPSGPVTAGTQYSNICTLFGGVAPYNWNSQVCRPG